MSERIQATAARARRGAGLKRVLVVLSVLLASAGCVSLPEQGAVHTDPDQPATVVPGTFDYNPGSARSGDDRAAVVHGFLDALRETPLTYTAARTFLTIEASSEWMPNKRTVVYGDGSLETSFEGDQAKVRLSSTVQLDSRGSWLGDPTGGRGMTFDLHLVRERGEWRIADPPDALIISRTHFDTRFVRYELNFFDPSGRVLVPEPVYLPAGDQAPSLLVSGLLAGPSPALQSVERTFFPAGTRLKLWVPVQDGVAEIPLTEEILSADTAQLDLAMAQLAWTLRQVPGIARMRVTVDGAPLDQTTGASARSVLGWSSYDPAVSSADTSMYALARGAIVSESDGETATLTTRYRSVGPRSVGVSLGGDTGPTQVSVVARDGRTVLTSTEPPALDPQRGAREVYVGTDVLRPAYDRFDHTWLVDRTARGARLVVLSPGGRSRPLKAPGVTGADVTAFEVSRDGTRLAAVVDGKVVLARIARSETGRPTRVLPGSVIPQGDGTVGRVVDVAWVTPETIGLLGRLGRTISQVMLVGVDGSFAPGAEPTSLEPLFETADDLVTWPGEDAPAYLRTRSGDVYQVSATGHWTLSDLPAGLRAPTFPG